jgi:hypothetical protein
MDSNYIIDPSSSIAELCSESGRFLEDDYYMAMSHHELPNNYIDRINKLEKSDRRIVIVGSKETPMTVTKNAFMALTLAKPEKLTIKAFGEDESILLNEMFQQNKKYHDCDYSVYQSKREEFASNGAWLRDIESATDVVVFGGLDTISFFNMESRTEQNIYLHKPKFSLGIVTKECLENEDNLLGLAGDFISFFGEGKLAPKFYITLGKLSDDQLIYIADCMKSEEDLLKEFRAKLPFSKKSLMINEKMFGNFIFPHVRNATFDSKDLMTPLFGDVRLIEAQHEGQIEDFISEFSENISSIAIDEEMLGDMVAGWDFDIPRYCDIGSMHFPYFYEPVDEVDDLDIYSKKFEEF